MPKNHPELTAERLRKLLAYDPETGIFIWLFARSKKALAGSHAGYIDRKGYRRIRIDGKAHSAHRLAWLYVHGHWPKKEIDHKNREKSENRIDNLRDVTHETNQQNLKTYSNNKSGHPGVSWQSDRGKWLVEIMTAGKKIYLGRYLSIVDAIEARAAAEAIHRP